MNLNGLVKHYATLTPEERFRLIVAANDRGDEAESQRLISAAKRCTFSNMDYSPYAHALQELSMLIFLELLEYAAECDDAHEQWSDAVSDLIGYKKSKRGVAKKESSGQIARTFETYLAHGFILRTRAAGWKLFCERMGIAPFGLWQYLPGFERLRRVLAILEGTADRPGGPAFTPAGMMKWLNHIRPDGVPEVTEASILSPESVADSTDALFHERARWWGADC
jgi:hypothetical protein